MGRRVWLPVPSTLDLGVVIQKPEQTEPQHAKQGIDEKRTVPVPPQHHGNDDRPDNHDPTHGWSAGLVMHGMYARIP
jgi:hypothetical protein